MHSTRGNRHCWCPATRGWLLSNKPNSSQPHRIQPCARAFPYPAGVLTPAISVVSAIEGIQFQTGISTGAVVGISIAILVSRLQMLSVARHLWRGLQRRRRRGRLLRLPTHLEPTQLHVTASQPSGCPAGATVCGAGLWHAPCVQHLQVGLPLCWVGFIVAYR